MAQSFAQRGGVGEGRHALDQLFAVEQRCHADQLATGIVEDLLTRDLLQRLVLDRGHVGAQHARDVVQQQTQRALKDGRLWRVADQTVQREHGRDLLEHVLDGPALAVHLQQVGSRVHIGVQQIRDQDQVTFFVVRPRQRDAANVQPLGLASRRAQMAEVFAIGSACGVGAVARLCL